MDVDHWPTVRLPGVLPQVLRTIKRHIGMICPRCNTENKLNPDAPQADQFCWKCNGPLSQEEVRQCAERARIVEEQKTTWAAIRRQR